MVRSALRRLVAIPLAFTVVVALTAVAAGFAAPAAPAAPAAVQPGAGQYMPVTPSRIVSNQSIDAGKTYTFSPLGKGGVPATNVSAVALTMTGRSGGTGNGQLIAFPAGITKPGTSNVNYRPGISSTNSVTVRLGSGGQISVNNEGATSAALLWVDVLGYYTTSAAAGSGSTYVGIAPTRLFDDETVTPDQEKVVSPLGQAGVPATNVSAVVVNIIVHGNGAVGEALAYPDGVSRQWHTMVFYQGDFVYNNQVAVKLGTGGRFRLYTSTATKVDVDVVGYFQAPAGAAAGGSFTGTDPSRLAPVFVGGGGTYTFSPLGQGGIPVAGVSAVAFNLTATQATASHTLTVYPAGIDPPVPANQLSYRQGPWPAQQYVKLGANGQVSIHNNGQSEVRLLIDLLGYYRAPAAPAAPTAVTGQQVDGAVDVRWTRPATDGGASVTGYRITVNPGNQTVDVIDVTSAMVSGLSNGTAYTFTVAARNAAGTGPASAASAAIIPRAPTAPGAPPGATAQARDKSAAVRWEKPADGGRTVTAYTVTATPGGATATVIAPVTTAVVAGLTNGTAYTFAVTATNPVGTGPAGRSASVTPGLTVPDAPGQAVAASAGNGAISVGWTAPRYTGGSALTGYVVTVQPGGRTVAVAANTTETYVTGLTAGAPYTIAVAARNTTGLSPQSKPSRPVRPDLQLKAGVRQLSAAAIATINAFGITRLTFTNAPAEVTGLTVGAIIVAPPGGRAQDGFVRKVTAVSTSGATTTVDGVNVDPRDAYATAGFSTESDFSEGTTTTPGFRAMADDGPTLTIPIPPTKLRNKIQVSGSISLDLAAGMHENADGERVLTLSGTLNQSLTVQGIDKSSDDDHGDVTTLPRDRLPLCTKQFPFLNAILEFVRPSLSAEVYLWADGSWEKDAKMTFTSSQTISIEIDIKNPSKPTVEFGGTGGMDFPQFWSTGNFKIGVGIDITGKWSSFFDIGRINFQGYADNTFDPLGNPAVVSKGCVRLGAEGPGFKNDSLVSRCPVDFEILNPIAPFPIYPAEARTTRGGKVPFTARNKVPGNPVKWSVDGAGNGSIDPDSGVYTAPADKDGTFVIRAKAEKIGIFPAEEGRAIVRVGPPGKPTVLLAPASPSDGDNRVRITIGAPTTGTAPTSYRAYVQPNLAPYSRCLGFWEIPRAGTFTLADQLETDNDYNCGLLPLGAQIRFVVYAENDIGFSAPGESGVITVTG